MCFPLLLLFAYTRLGSGIEYVAGKLIHLEHLSLSRCYALSDASLIALCQLQKLKSLHLAAVSQVTDAGLRGVVAKGALCLEDIDLSSCAMISDAGVQSLAHACPDLRRVNLYRCSLITDQSRGAHLYRSGWLVSLES